MVKRALIDRRPYLLLSIGAALAYYLLVDSKFPGAGIIIIKGVVVGLLAIYALLRFPHRDGRLLALVLGLAAVGDMAMELEFRVGGGVFFASHVAAMALYLRNRRAVVTPSQKLFAATLLFLTPLITWLLVANLENALQVTLYSLALGGMASLAWTSSFPRYRVGIGAVLFVFSDLLIFARMDLMATSPVPDLLIWPIYYLGQFLIATGVIQTLRHDLPRE
jgi:uncharacterized membrane protein YhhN